MLYASSNEPAARARLDGKEICRTRELFGCKFEFGNTSRPFARANRTRCTARGVYFRDKISVSQLFGATT